MASDYWMKFYIRRLDDPAYVLLPDRLWRRVHELELFAKELGKDGALPGLNGAAWRLRFADLAGMADDLQELCARGFLEPIPTGYMLPHFKAEQAPSTDAERKRAQRERQRKAGAQPSTSPRTDVTKRDGHLSKSRLTENRLTETETEPDTEDGAGAFTGLDPAFENDGYLIAETVYRQVTGFMTYPETARSASEQALLALLRIYPIPEDLVTYLRRFWTAWNDPDRVTSEGRRYSPTNCKWLTEWAITNYIPPIPRKPETAADPKTTNPASIAAELARKAAAK